MENRTDFLEWIIALPTIDVTVYDNIALRTALEVKNSLKI
jgi:hypothetical protein